LATTAGGAVFSVPPYAASLYRDGESHRHILLGTDEAAQEGLLVYGTSANTQCQFGAPCFALDAPPHGPPDGGVAHVTHFNGAALRRVPLSKLTKQRGVLTPPYHQALRHRVTIGLGWKSGLGIHQRIGYPTSRGLIVRLTKAARVHFQTRYAVLLTAHTYSPVKVGAPGGEQEDIIVPIFDTRLTTTVRMPPHWIHISAPWGKQITGFAETIAFVVAPENVASVRREDGIKELYPQSIGAAEMDRIETDVDAYLGLGSAAASAAVARLALCPAQR